jgi:hypothetical protein
MDSMIVNRWTFVLTGAHAEEAWAIFKAEMIKLHPQQRMRFYGSNIAPLCAWAWEAEYESLAEFDKAREARNSAISPESVKKFFELAHMTGGTNEIWDVD